METAEQRTTPAPDVRNRLAIALDVDDLVQATRIAKAVRPWFGVAKVGLELYTAAGPDAIVALQDRGFRVFLDIKLHDIPTTVRKAAQVAGGLGVSYLTVHATGGPTILRAAVDGLADGAEGAGLPSPTALAVTVLTSERDAPSDVLRRRVQAALEAGCGGLVCAASDLAQVRQLAPKLTTVVPGIRPAGAPVDDQGRVATPLDALRAGADLLVIGRAVTGADDKAAAAAALVGELPLERRGGAGDGVDLSR